MTTDKADIDRRTVLKGLGGLATVGAVGVGGMTLTGSGMAASSSLDISDPSAVTTDDGNIKRVTLNLSHSVSWDGFDKPVDAVAWKDTLTVRPKSDNPVTHTVYDNTQSPVLLENFSSKGDGSDGWGGSGEWAEYQEGQHAKESGEVHADIDWNVIVDPRYAGPQSVEDPYEIDGNSVIEPTTDGETLKSGIEYKKALYFYTTDRSKVRTDSGEKSVGLLTGDGVKKVEKASDTFTLTVTNQDSTATNTGSGGTSAE